MERARLVGGAGAECWLSRLLLDRFWLAAARSLTCFRHVVALVRKRINRVVDVPGNAAVLTSAKPAGEQPVAICSFPTRLLR